MTDPLEAGETAQVRPRRRSRVRADIQGLRALAVLAVIADHLLNYPLGGFVGVDVFFVLSGFLITGIVLREHDRTGHISFTGFYRRRIRRILPMATLVLLVTVGASFLLLSRTRADAVSIDGIWALFFAENWHAAAIGTDYFQLGLPPSPLQHYWSLSVEEQFYFVWPWLLLGILFVAAKLGLGGSNRRTIVVLFAVATAASFVWSLFETARTPDFAYFSTFSRAWELGVGALVAALAASFHRIPSWIRPALAWAGLLGILASIFLVITPATPFPGPGGLLPVLSTAAVIIAGTGSTDKRYDRALFPLTSRVTGYIGNISYSLYLWHLPVIVLLVAVFPAGSRRYLVASILLIFVLSIVSYHVVETPVRDSRWLEPKRIRSRTARTQVGRPRILIAAVIVAAVAASTVGVVTTSLLTPTSAVSVPLPSASGGPTSCFGAAAMDPDRRCTDPSNHSLLVPSADTLAADTGDAFMCFGDQYGPYKPCSLGDPGAKTHIALVGDSHAAMLIPALEKLVGPMDLRVDVYVGFGCQWRANNGTDCADTIDAAQEKLTDPAHPYDAVITTSARWATKGDLTADAENYVALWKPVSELGTRVIVLGDNPVVSQDAIQCISRIGFDPIDNDCATPRKEALAQEDGLVLATKLLPAARLIDLTDFFCTDSSCPAVVGNVIVYRDTADHMTATYSETLAPFLGTRLAAALDGLPTSSR